MRKLKHDLWPYMVSVEYQRESLRIDTWLGENMGVFKDRWNMVYSHKTLDYYFRNERDAMWFALRWA